MLKITKIDIEYANKVEESVCRYFSIETKKLNGKTRKRDVSLSRQFVWYILHYDFSFSINKLVIIYGRKNRWISRAISQIKYAVENQNNYLETYKNIKNDINNKKK